VTLAGSRVPERCAIIEEECTKLRATVFALFKQATEVARAQETELVRLRAELSRLDSRRSSWRQLIGSDSKPNVAQRRNDVSG
jgi:hypothetical protein